MAAAIVVTITRPARVRGDGTGQGELTMAARPWHAAIGVGGFLALTGPVDAGPAAVIEILPGRRFGRMGLRLEARGLGWQDKDWLASCGVYFEAGAARPRLAIALHAEVGARSLAAVLGPVVGGGVTTQLSVWGPLALGLDGSATVLLGGVDTALALSSAMTIRLVH